jgi:hypothetical protein
MDSIRSKRFFDALVKPKHESGRIGVVSSSQDMKDGAIYSSLPIYKVFLSFLFLKEKKKSILIEFRFCLGG